MRVDVMLWQDVCHRGAVMLQAMIDAAPHVGVKCRVTTKGSFGAPILMTWGMGHLARRVYLDSHRRNKGRVIAWDLGYWNRGARNDPEQSYRVTIDHEHPWRLLKAEDPERFEKDQIVLREDANPEGPILLAAMGKKSKRLYPKWELARSRQVAAKYPGKPIEFRGKDKDGPTIESALKGKALVVCRHSNVAIDACIAGVPVECEDGAAYALYRDNPAPTREQRLAFLQRVAHWQWKPGEAVEAWKFLLKALG